VNYFKGRHGTIHLEQMKTDQPKSVLAGLFEAWKEADRQQEIAWQELVEFAQKYQDVAGTWRKLRHYCHLEGPVDRQLFLNRLAGIESPPELKARSERKKKKILELANLEIPPLSPEQPYES
jgi:hypothetical protein